MTDGTKTFPYQTTQAFVTDLDTALPSADANVLFWQSSFQPSGLPSYDGNYWQGMTMKSAISGYYTQVCFGLGDSAFFRVRNDSGVWGIWKKLIIDSVYNQFISIADAVRYSATNTQREVFYGMRDQYILEDANGATAFVIGNVDGVPFDNIYQMSGVRYFRNGSTTVYQVQWNQDVATGKTITILFTRI